MLVFATVGLIVRHIPLPESVIAFCRAFLGAFSSLSLPAQKGEAAREKLWEHRYKLFPAALPWGLPGSFSLRPLPARP